MPTGSTFADSSPSRSSRSRSILSRIASPLTSRTRNLSDFYIRPDEPHRQYSPGDLVKGAVVLIVVKPVRVTHLVVRLHGHVRVFNTPNATGGGVFPDGGFGGAAGTRRGGEYPRNGYTPLFEDEVTLCGEGRLEVGRYEFRFELEFPTKGVPSSIDFERGTISYVITSTITRPTTISPTTIAERKIYLVESIDVGPLAQAKKRVITLNPISRHKKTRKKDPHRLSRLPLSRENSNRSGSIDSVPQDGAPGREPPLHTPSQSEVSAQSIASATSSTRSSAVGPALSLAKESDVQSLATSQAEKTITVTIQLLQGGCLPGDILPVRLSINHTKPIKSMEGIVVTLYRLGRIDSQPFPPAQPMGKGKGAARSGHEQEYPKSRTGLGGLSFSSAGRSGVFRKDLSQTFAPMLVDPATLATVVKTSVRVPEDAFPTISSVPGGMMSFRYYVEVIVDLGGKLAAGHDMFTHRLGTSSMITGSQNSGHVLHRDERGMQEMVSTFSGSLLDTDQIRREKSVAACLFEVVVGTWDSGRRKIPRGPSVQQLDDRPGFIVPQSEDVRLSDADQEPGALPAGSQHVDPGQATSSTAPHQSFQPSMEAVPPPIIEDEEHLDEKTRMKRAEERLLPSQPPDDPPQSPRVGHRPTAPEALDSGPLHHAVYTPPSTPIYTHHPPCAPAFSDPAVPPSQLVSDLPHPSPTSHPTDDKQELQRRRLELEASAPEDFPDDGVGLERPAFPPTAPTLSDDEDGLYPQQPHPHPPYPGRGGPSSEPPMAGEALPRYER